MPMPSASALRLQIENSLQARIPAALSARPAGVRESISCGIPALDDLTKGGFPVGAMSELVGPDCSGRTTAALSFLAGVTAEGSVCAWIDVADALDPEAAAANGVDLDRLLWVRCAASAASQANDSTTGMALPEPNHSERSKSTRRTGGSTHPRMEGRGMSQAIQTLLEAQPRSAALQPRRNDRSIGTPGAPNRPLTQSIPGLVGREEQIPTDRLPPRRGSNLGTADMYKTALLNIGEDVQQSRRLSSERRPMEGSWSALDRALRASDLLLQAGGFRAIVLDLGSTPAEQAWRIPPATWFRFRAACQRSRVSFLLLTQHPCAHSSAEIVLRMRTGTRMQHGRVMTGITYHSELDRHQQHRSSNLLSGTPNVISIRKPPHREQGTAGQWQAAAAWIHA